MMLVHYANHERQERKGGSMQIRYFQIDAFAERVFSGNPAGVCLLETWLEDKTMQAVAAENGLPETAFLVPSVPCGASG